MPSPRLLLAWIVGITVALLLVAPAALADPTARTVSVNFQVDRQAVPDYLCVVARNIHDPEPTAPKKAAQPAKADAPPAAEPPPGKMFRSDADALSSLELTRECKAGRGCLSLLDRAPPLCASSKKGPLCDAITALKASPNAIGLGVHPAFGPVPAVPVAAPQVAPSPSCTVTSANGETVQPDSRRGVREPCLPSLQLTEDPAAKIICSANTQRSDAGAADASPSARVAVLRLEPAEREAPPTLRSIALHGEVGVLRFEYAAGKTVVLASAGGHYLASSERAVSGDSTVFPLLQRCGRHRVVMPPSAALGGDVCAIVDFGEGKVARNVTLQSSTGELDIPYSMSTAVRSIEIRSGDLKSRYQWTDPRPPLELRTGVMKLAVSWRAHCLQPWGTCPTLTLPETSATCTKPNLTNGMCSYTCEGSTPFALPVQAAFTTQPVSETPAPRSIPGKAEWAERWTETLSYSGQTLDGYVAAEERHVAVDLRSWVTEGKTITEVRKRNGETLDALLIRTPYGETYRLKVEDDRAWLRIPQVGCGDTLSYQAVGALDYAEEPEQVKNGVLPVKPPHLHMQRVVSFGAAFGGGALIGPDAIADTKERPHAVAEAVITARVGARYLHSWPWRPNLELRAGGLLAVQWFESLRPTADRDDGHAEVADHVWYMHVPISLNLVHVQTAPIQLGVGVGLDVGFPLLEEDNRLAYWQNQPFLNVFGGWWLTRAVALELGARFLPQRLYSYRFDYRGQPEAEPEGRDTVLTLIEGRVRFGN